MKFIQQCKTNRQLVLQYVLIILVAIAAVIFVRYFTGRKNLAQRRLDDADAFVLAPVTPRTCRPLKSGDMGSELEYLFDIPEEKRAWNFVVELLMKLSEHSVEFNGPDD